MIKKGLKVGDTFVDGGITYVVTALDGDNYVSTVYKEEAPKKRVASKDVKKGED